MPAVAWARVIIITERFRLNLILILYFFSDLFVASVIFIALTLLCTITIALCTPFLIYVIFLIKQNLAFILYRLHAIILFHLVWIGINIFSLMSNTNSELSLNYQKFYLPCMYLNLVMNLYLPSDISELP